MSYFLYSLTFASFVIVTLLYVFRAHWTPYIPITDFAHRYNPLPASFQDDAEAGLHSSNFSLADNIEAEDGRGGLDQEGKREVLRIMKRRNVNFDEARRIVMQAKFKKGGVGEDGLPRDPKFVSFS